MGLESEEAAIVGAVSARSADRFGSGGPEDRLNTTPYLLTKLATSVLIAGAALLIGACGGGGAGDSQSSTAQPPSGSNTPPAISGQAQTSVRVGEAYTFQPTASDADGDTLQFAAANLPSWVHIDTVSGRISGTPAAADVGNYAGITISVSDGKATVSLSPFGISVTQIGTGAATVSWVPPTMNEDGTALTNLAGYRLRYGRSDTDLSELVAINSPAINTYVIDNLSSGTWFFAVIAVNSQGVESARSNVASKTI
jgi:Putative Ig domain